MKQFLFVILSTLITVSLSAQDAQIYRKGSSGYVLSVPYTRTKDNEPKPSNDKKDDKKNTTAKEKEVVIVIEEEEAQTDADQGSLEIVIEEEDGLTGEESVEEEEAAIEEEITEDLAEEEFAFEEEADETIETEEEIATEEIFEKEEPPVKVVELPRKEALEIDGSETVKTATVEQIKNNTKAFSNVLLEGELTLQLGDREFILTDSTGSLKVELTHGAEYFVNNAVLLGSTVQVLGIVKKRMWNDVAVEGVKARVIIPSAITDDLKVGVENEDEYESDDVKYKTEVVILAEDEINEIIEETEDIIEDEDLS